MGNYSNNKRNGKGLLEKDASIFGSKYFGNWHNGNKEGEFIGLDNKNNVTYFKGVFSDNKKE